MRIYRMDRVDRGASTPDAERRGLARLRATEARAARYAELVLGIPEAHLYQKVVDSPLREEFFRRANARGAKTKPVGEWLAHGVRAAGLAGVPPHRGQSRPLRGTALAALTEGEATLPPPYPAVREAQPAAPRRGSFLSQRLGPAGGAPAWLWMLGAFSVIAGVGWWQRRAIMKGASMAFDFAKGGIFKAVLAVKEPDAVAYADVILGESQRADVAPFITVALGKRESNWGRSLDADQTGDYTARTGNWLREAGVRVVDSVSSPWRAPKDGDGNTIPGPYAIPEDGLGWGRGIMQIDWPRTRKEGHAWRNPQANVALGLVVYKEKLAELVAAPSGSWTISAALAKRLRVAPGTYPAKAIPADLAPVAALAAYNAGAAAIRRAFSAAGQAGIDLVTTGGDYAKSTSATIVALQQAFNQQSGQGTAA